LLKQKFIVHFGSHFFVRIIGIFAGIIVARIAGPQVMGTISYGTSYVGLWGFISGLFGSGHIKLISEGQDIGKCMSVYTRLFMASVVLYFLVVLGFFLAQKYVFRVEFESTAQQAVILILLLGNIFSKFYHYSSTTFTATMEQARAVLPMFAKDIFWHIGRMLIVVLGFQAIGLATWNLVITILFLPLVYSLIKKYPRTGWDHHLFKRYVGYAIPIFLIVVINSIIHYSDKLFLVHYTSTTELGYFSAANSIGGVVMIASLSISKIFFPLFSSMLAREDWCAVRKNILQYQEFLSIFAFPVVCSAVIISGPFLTMVLGKQYEPSIRPFIIIAFATYIVVAGMPYGNIITGAGRFYLNVWINLIKLAVFAASITFFLSPRFLALGATGLALNLLTVNLLINFLYLQFAKYLGNISFFDIKILLRYLLIFSAAIVFYLYQDHFNQWTVFWWVIAAPFFIIFVYSLMLLLGLMNMIHFKQLADLLNVSKVVSYVKGEFSGKSK